MSTLTIIDEAEFCAWVGRAEPGDILEYHRGHLAADLDAGQSPATKKALRALARRAYWASQRDLVHLVQRRVGPRRFSYLAIRRARPRAGRIAAAALVDALVVVA